MPLFMMFRYSLIFNNHSQSTIIHSFIVRNSQRPAFLYPAAFCSEMFSLPWNGITIPWIRYASSFVPRNRIPSCFLFRGMVLSGVPKVSFYFCYMDRNSEFFSLPQNGWEWNSESFCFNFCSTERNFEQFSLPQNLRGFCSAEKPKFRRK